MALSTISARIETKDKERFDKFCEKVGLSTCVVEDVAIAFSL